MSDRGVNFEAGGTSYRLFLGTAAMLRYERSAKAAGQPESVLQAAEKMQGGDMTIERLVRLFGCGLEPQLKEDEIAELIDELGFTESMELLGDAMTKAFGGLEEPEPAKNSKRASRGRR